MKKLISGMFSSVTDAELILATNGYNDEAFENVTDHPDDIASKSSLSQTGSSAAASIMNEVPYQNFPEDTIDDPM